MRNMRVSHEDLDVMRSGSMTDALRALASAGKQREREREARGGADGNLSKK